MRSPLTTALLHPLNQAMLVLAVLAGLLAAWWLFPLGLALWIVMVAHLAGDRSIRSSFDMQSRAGTLSTRFQEHYNRVVQAQTRINNFFLNAGGSTEHILLPVQSEVDALVDRVYILCRKMTAPENYLKVSRNTSDLEGERSLLQLALEGETDPLVRREKEEVLNSLNERRKKNQDIEKMLKRVEAQLASTTAVLDGVLADIMRVYALGGKKTRQELPAILRQIRDQVTQLDAFESEIAELV
jgi:hypothetical protein